MRRLLSLLLVAPLTGCAPATLAAMRQEPSTPQTVVTAGPPVQEAAPPAPAVPRRLLLWKFDAPVVRIGLDNGSLTPPPDPAVLGWWGRRPGAAQGTTLLTGHTVHTGGGELDDLEHTPVGTTATVGGVRYTVTDVAILSKAQVARRAEDLFSLDGPHRLVIVTCEDYDTATGHYDSNVVVTATPTA